MKHFPHYAQHDLKDCGPTSLRMIAKYYGRSYSLQTLRDKSYISREGVSMLGISDAAESIGFRTSGIKASLKQLKTEIPLPCILHWGQCHFVVLYAVKQKNRGTYFHIADPASGLCVFTEDDLRKHWISTNEDDEDLGTALLLEPTPEFYKSADESKVKRNSIMYFFGYLIPYKKQMIQLMLGMVATSLLQLIMPFLTQALVDVGVQNNNLNFISLVLIAQLVISISKLSVEFIRSWIMLHVNSRINIALISDFLAKLMKLPLHFFDTKMVGDILQRIGDHNRIEMFITGSSFTTLFSFLNFILFGFILAYYNIGIFVVFSTGNILYVVWVYAFMKQRRELDIRRFTQASGEKSNLYQLVTGMQEIKLNNNETQKRWQWERIQIKLFKIEIKGLALQQYQQIGSIFFNQATNIFISFLAAKSVVEGNMTLGMMMSLTYIVGQLSSPIEQFIGFSRSLQDAKISLERLSEIHLKEDEEEMINQKVSMLPKEKNIEIEHLYFSYSGADRNYVLKDINLVIPENKITAIVGASGSGKTTLIKLLLGFYQPNEGLIKLGNTLLSNINPHLWRAKTGSVMQDGFIFSDTIGENITIGNDSFDETRLKQAIIQANISDYVDSLPLGLNTKIGMEGNGLSQGQKQRILIARAIYKNPDFIFLDEATNALDASNEKEIMENLNKFYIGRTVVVVAHRLSTVRHADKIIVLDHGSIVETGSHTELINKKGNYYNLVKDQLELGN